jgi:spore germination protein GerM
MTRRRRAVGAAGASAVVLACGLALGACGIPTQLTASPISANLSQTRPPTRAPVSPCTKSGCVSVDVYFVTRTGHLGPVDRVVPRVSELATAIRSLLAGPTAPEEAEGITTVLGADIVLQSTSVTSKKKIVTLDFNADFGTLSGPQEVLGVAQVVYTVTSVSPGAGVTFEIDDVPIEVPVETGVAVTTPVHEAQYLALRTTTVPTTTTTTTP